MFAPDPKPPTPSEYAVLVVVSSTVLIIIGIVAVVMALRAPPEKHDLAVHLGHIGLCSFGLGVVLAGIFWLYRRLMD
jgi:uncharacterized membrane protein